MCVPFCIQSHINKILNGLHFTRTCLDDIIIFSETPEELLTHIKIVLPRLRQANLKMKRSECCFLQEKNPLPRSLTYDRLHKASTEMVKAISEFKQPTSQKVIKNFLELLVTIENLLIDLQMQLDL